jgi:hypothetical protein
MLFVKLTRSNAVDGLYQHALIAGPYEDDIDAKYYAKTLKAGDSNKDSAYEVVNCEWVVAVARPGNPKTEVISWHETEEDCKHNAAAAQRGDYTVVVEPMKFSAWLEASA